MLARHVLVALVLAAAACGGDSDDGGGDGSDGADDGGDGDDGEGDDGDDDGTGGGEGDDGDPDEPPGPESGTPAAGISIDAISINQGVEIPIAEGGVFIPEPERNAPVIGKRPALVRAFWNLEDGFEPRELEARLVLTYPDGSVKVFTDERTVDGPSNPTSYPGGFAWGILEEDFLGDVDFHVAVYETDGVDRGAPSSYRLPAEGEEPLRGVTKRMLLDVVVVPTCNRAPIADWEQEIFTAYLYNTFPINELQITFHDPVASGCDEYEAAYTTMPDLRFAEDAPPWRYYGGLVNGSCGGIAQYGDGPWAWEKDAPRAFGLCDWRYTFPTVDLFAHELGHVHSRNHTFEDSYYPYDTCGVRENVGFGLMPAQMPSSSWGDQSEPMQQLIPPSRAGCTEASWNDFMSYAYPYWISDYTYRGIAELIWHTSTWADEAGAIQPSPGVTLRGAVRDDGRVHWGATRGVTDLRIGDTLGTPARFYLGDELVGEHPVEVEYGHHDPGPNDPQHVSTPVQVLTVRLPQGVVGDRFELELGGQRRTFSTANWR